MPKGTGKGAASKIGRRYADLTGGALADHRELGAATMSSPPPSDAAVNSYTGYMYANINGPLRSGEEEDMVPDARSVQRELDALFRKPGARLQSDALLYRGVGSRDPILTQLRAGTLRAGTVFADKGFMSTTVDKERALNFASGGLGDRVVLRVRAKRGKRAVHVEEASQHRIERETLLPRDSKIRVKGIRTGTITTPFRDESVTFIDVDLM